jgi:hypothetical protein
LSDYIYFKLIIEETLQPALTQKSIYRILVGIVIGGLVGIALELSFQYFYYLFYSLLVVYVIYILYRFNFRSYSVNITKVFKDYKKISIYNKFRVIKGLKEFDTEEKLKLVSKRYFKRWKFDDAHMQMLIEMIFSEHNLKPTDVKELIYQIFIYGHLANDESYHMLSLDFDKSDEDSKRIDQLYLKVFGSQSS